MLSLDHFVARYKIKLVSLKRKFLFKYDNQKIAFRRAINE